MKSDTGQMDNHSHKAKEIEYRIDVMSHNECDSYAIRLRLLNLKELSTSIERIECLFDDISRMQID